ncbi:hypothetical protein D3C85_891950 [compost metagenome]
MRMRFNDEIAQVQRFQMWFKGWRVAAFRQPDASWSNTKMPAEFLHRRLELRAYGGIVLDQRQERMRGGAGN